MDGDPRLLLPERQLVAGPRSLRPCSLRLAPCRLRLGSEPRVVLHQSIPLVSHGHAGLGKRLIGSTLRGYHGLRALDAQVFDLNREPAPCGVGLGQAGAQLPGAGGARLPLPQCRTQLVRLRLLLRKCQLQRDGRSVGRA
eukprot:scaffold82_cov105-Isochrysis_galbana.AAC.3